MRPFMTAFSRLASCSGAPSNRAALRRIAGLTALATLLAFTPGFAKEPAEPETKGTSKIKPVAAPTTAAETAIPACLEKLSLTKPQQNQAKEIVRKYDASLDAVWKKFGEKYMETVRTEVALLAAVEDNLTEPQRMKVREERRRVAHSEKAMEGTKTKQNQATEEPDSAVEQASEGAGISLTDEQEDAADAINQKYSGHLRSLNRDIQGLHTRLISLEADKLVELEKILTKEQLAQLRDARQNVTGVARVTSAGKSADKTN